MGVISAENSKITSTTYLHHQLALLTLPKPRASPNPESTKQMEQTLRAKVKIFFKSENLKKCF